MVKIVYVVHVNDVINIQIILLYVVFQEITVNLFCLL